MGGEKSKNSGEYGEKIVGEFLELIGWKNARKGTPLKCINPEEHAKSLKSRSHGIDFGFTYLSPLIDEELINCSISVKFNEEKYPSGIDRSFLEKVKDISDSIECYGRSDQRAEALKGFTKYKNINEIGILFWLTNNIEIRDDLISKLSGTKFSGSSLNNTLFLVDDKRFDFISNSINFANKQYPDYETTFHYPRTGKNINPILNKTHGKILPVEYINASILPFRLGGNNIIKLLITSLEPFSGDNLKKLLGLCQQLNNGWASGIIISFPDYNEHRHAEIAKIALSGFEEISLHENLTINKY